MAGAAPDCCQVIDSEGAFCEEGLSRFVQQHGVIDARTNYQVVAIMGPQSSGKSTLMNHVFGTRFQEMDAMSGRHQTTKGVWLARSPKVDEFTTLILDLEGSDGRERGEDDTNFERQSALFALAVADVLLINVWCHDIGREQGSGKPLMKTIFQVNLKLFAPEPHRRRTVLLFVIRDKSKTPLAKLVEVLSEDVTKMWDSISKPPQYANSQISDFFEVQYTALPHYEDKYEDFIADTVVLRRRFTPEGDDTLLRHGDKLPADSLVLSTKNIWGIIKSQKDLNLPAHKVMVANIRCAEIMKDQLAAFSRDQAWLAVRERSSAALVRDFGPTVGALLDSCLQGYEVEAMYFDAAVRAEHGAKLQAALEDAVAPALKAQLRLLAAEQLAGFDKDLKVALVEQPHRFSATAADAAAAALAGFEQRCGELLVPGTDLSADDARAALAADIDAATHKAKQARVDDALGVTEVTLSKLMAVNAVELLSSFPPDLWQQLHATRKQAVAAAGQELLSSLSGVELSPEESEALTGRLRGAADKKLADLLQEAALTRVNKMRDAFNRAFSLDGEGTPRTWRPSENIPAIARAARREAARVLALLAVVRGPNYKGGDVVEEAIMHMVRKDIDADDDASNSATSSSANNAAVAANNGSSSSSSAAASPAKQPGSGVFEVASATSWPGVAPGDVLVAPHEARLAWREFMSASALSVQQAKVTQHTNMMAGKRSAPIWALAAIAFLGWNEFMAVLWNPLLLAVGLLVAVFGYQMYNELDVDAEMQRGWVLGAMSIWNRLGATLSRVFQHNVELLQHAAGAVGDQVHHHGSSSQQHQGGLAHAYAGGGGGGAMASEQQQRQQYSNQSAAGLKQRSAAARDVQMMQLRGSSGGPEEGFGDS